MGEESITVDETNRLRAELGLAPLQVEHSGGKAEEKGRSEDEVARDNLVSYREEQQKVQHEQNLGQRIEK